MPSASRRSVNASRKSRSMRQAPNMFANLRMRIQQGRNAQSRANQNLRAYAVKKTSANIKARNERLKRVRERLTQKQLVHFANRVRNSRLNPQ